MTERIDKSVETKYSDDINKLHKQEKNVCDIRCLLKEELCPKFTHVIGIFGSYKHVFSDGTVGSDVYTHDKKMRKARDKWFKS